MSPAGFSSSIAAKAFLTRAIIRRGWCRSRSGSRRKAARKRRASARSPASRNGSPPRRARGRRNPRRATSATTNCSRRPARSRRRPRRSSFRSPNGSARTWSISNDLKKGFGDNLLIDDLTFKLPPGGIVGVIGPNGAGKTTLFRMITGQDKPDAGDDQGRRVGATRLCRSVARLARRQEVGVGGNFRRPRSAHARQARGEFARLLLGLQFQGRRSAEEGRPALGRRAQPRASRQDAQIRRQCSAARRADQRSRRRHAARARRGAWRISPAAP